MTRNELRKTGFTLIELLVVVAIIALLISILLPSLSSAREQGKKAVCLSHQKGIATAMWSYANDDRSELLIPIQRQMQPEGGIEKWAYQTVNWFAWGGKSGTQPFQYSPFGSWLLRNDPIEGVNGSLYPEYDAIHRPLTTYIYPDMGEYGEDEAPEFSCPSDTGYPELEDIDDAPRYNAGRSLYQTLGNSFRASLNHYIDGTRDNPAGTLTVSAWGKASSKLRDTGRLVLAGEPLFFNMIGKDEDPPPGIRPTVPMKGWHKREMETNLVFADGSARTIRAQQQDIVDNTFGNDLISYTSLTRGTGYRLDTYPIPGVVIWQLGAGRFSSGGWPQNKWPVRGHTVLPGATK